MKIKVNDKIKVTSGKDKGKEGTVERVYKNRDAVLVPGVNMYKKHVKKSEQMPQGGLVELPRALNVAKISIICPKCKEVTRVGYKLEGKTKNRICKKCKSII